MHQIPVLVLFFNRMDTRSIFSKKFCKILQYASTYVRELHDITAAVTMATLFVENKFIIKKDKR